MQTLTTAMGPLMDTKHPSRLKSRKSAKAWKRYVQVASGLFTSCLPTGNVVTVVSRPSHGKTNHHYSSFISMGIKQAHCFASTLTDSCSSLTQDQHQPACTSHAKRCLCRACTPRLNHRNPIPEELWNAARHAILASNASMVCTMSM
jgi:hypothetical protein